MAATTSQIPALLTPGSTFGSRYRIEALVGQGAAATVYRVREQEGGRRVALKQLRLSGGEHDAFLHGQFEREYHTLCQLAHPCIIEVYDYGVDANTPYYTMELLDGEDLHERGTVPVREACALLRDVASSLAILHSRGRVHRDVSARNVRCTPNGQAKLLDFGAMVPIGSHVQPVGTPPFVPPEALQLQALDGRVDLFALGALAYFMLTGRHAYPARTLSQLRDLWRSAPATPREYDPKLPPALDDLVMQLLQLERAARPRSAAEVMERLSGIADLPPQELPEVGRAYLTTPTLVGREAPLQRARAQLVLGMQGHGGSTLFEGAAGLGRSRMLDALVLEAKLLGAIVLRADSSDGRSDEYGVAKTLCGQLAFALPALVEQIARPRSAVLAHALPQLGGAQEASAAPARRHLQAALRDLFLVVARTHHVVVAIDDVEGIDEASAALLGMLAHGAQRRKLNLVLTARTDATDSPLRSLLRQTATCITLSPLAANETCALVQSLFGDVEHSKALATRIHALARGEPRWILALCAQLVERGIAVYRAGRWTLPPELDPNAVPTSLVAEFAARLAALPEGARALAEALALSDAPALPVASYATLCAQGDRARAFRALDDLIAAQVLVPVGECFRFSQPEYERLLSERVSAECARVLHARLAEVTRSSKSPWLHAHHLLHAGQTREAVEIAVALFNRSAPITDSDVIEHLEQLLSSAVECADELSPRLFAEALQSLVHWSAIIGRPAPFFRHCTTLLERLLRDSGLTDYDALVETSSSASIEQAIAHARERFAATPEAERVYTPEEAASRLSKLAFTYVTVASLGQDFALIAGFPSLVPLAPLYPEIALTVEELLVQKALEGGRFLEFLARSHGLRQRIDDGDFAGISEIDRQIARLKQLYMQGLVLSGGGIAVPAELIAALEQTPGFRAHAFRVRMSSELIHCDFAAGRASARRAELLNLQDGGFLPGSTLRIEMQLNIATSNLIGLQEDVKHIEHMARDYRAWRSTLAIAQCHCLLIQGKFAEALGVIVPAVELIRPGEHLDWDFLNQAHLMTLLALDRVDEVIVKGRAIEQQSLLARLPPQPGTRLALASALVRGGELDEALRLIDELIAAMTGGGSYGVYIGAQYELRARIAIALRDIPMLHASIERCAREFNVGEGSPMNARFERLLRSVTAAGLTLPESTRWLAASPRPAETEVVSTVHSRMLTCIGSVERAREVLRLLLEESSARSGYLFGLSGGRLQLLASVDEALAPTDLTRVLEEYLRGELEDLDRLFDGATRTRLARRMQIWVDSWGREFEPLLLSTTQDGEQVIAGVAALHRESDERFVFRPELLRALTSALLAEDLVDPITCMN